MSAIGLEVTYGCRSLGQTDADSLFASSIAWMTGVVEAPRP